MMHGFKLEVRIAAVLGALTCAGCSGDDEELVTGPSREESNEAPSNGTGGSVESAGSGGGGGVAPLGMHDPSAPPLPEVTGGEDCWQLPSVDRARLLPAPGAAASLVGGRIMGSNTSAMNDFVELASIDAAPAEGQWVELTWSPSSAYRYVKYYAPPNSFGVVAELELYSGDERAEGRAFGTVPADDGGHFALAFDGDAETGFRGALPTDNYVGLDLAADHVVPTPIFEPAAGHYDSPPELTIASAPSTTVVYTLDGSDPLSAGEAYSGPLLLAEGATVVRAAATHACAWPSEVARARYTVGAEAAALAPTSQASMHIGNSLTDTIVDLLPALAESGGISLDFNRYTVPGAGTWLYVDNPSGGFGVADVQGTLSSRPFDHLSVQPFPNQPCQPVASADGPDSDASYIERMWSDAKAQNPNVQLWIYQQWPSPIDFTNCITGGEWTRADWRPPAPASWEDAVENELAYDEAVRAELVRQNPDDPPPFIVPSGSALASLKREMEAGRVPGMSDFFVEIFAANGTDLHLSSKGAFLVTAVFYASMFQSEPPPSALEASVGLSAEQAAVFRRVAWETVSSYPLSGVPSAP